MGRYNVKKEKNMSEFKDLGLSEELLAAITDLGFVEPTPIQQEAIPHLLNTDIDLVALAQTGTGKTAAFGLPVIEKTDLGKKFPQALILSPTRELAIQITKDIQNYAKHIRGLRVTAVYGGTSIEGQIKDLNRGTQIVVGTPGRVLDLSKRRRLDLSKISFLVLDEADEMLNMGFKDELDDILAHTPEDKQVLLFSATMPREVARIAKKYMTDATTIEVGKRNEGAKNVDHSFYSVAARDKYKVLKRVADMVPEVYGIVFCRTRRETREVAEKLIQDNYNADALHGDLSQAQRDLVMHRFRVKNIQLLVATDVAARGLDVNDLTHVINFSLPDEEEAYIQRTGRTGRAGKSGKAISIVHQKEVGKLRRIEKKLGKEIKKELVPGGKEICEKRLFSLVDRMEKIEVNEEQIAEFLPVIFKKLDWLSKEDLIKHFVSVEFNRFLEYYKNAEDLNIKTSDRGRGGRESAGDYTRFFINVGKKDDLKPAELIGFINRQLSGHKFDLGRIDILRNFSFFEIDSAMEAEVISKMNKATFDDITLLVEVAKPKGSGGNRGGGRSRDRGSRDSGRSRDRGQRKDSSYSKDKDSSRGDRSRSRDDGFRKKKSKKDKKDFGDKKKDYSNLTRKKRRR